jgi:hypothetical protein
MVAGRATRQGAGGCPAAPAAVPGRWREWNRRTGPAPHRARRWCPGHRACARRCGPRGCRPAGSGKPGRSLPAHQALATEPVQHREHGGRREIGGGQRVVHLAGGQRLGGRPQNLHHRALEPAQPAHPASVDAGGISRHGGGHPRAGAARFAGHCRRRGVGRWLSDHRVAVAARGRPGRAGHPGRVLEGARAQSYRAPRRPPAGLDPQPHDRCRGPRPHPLVSSTRPRPAPAASCTMPPQARRLGGRCSGTGPGAGSGAWAVHPIAVPKR